MSKRDQERGKRLAEALRVNLRRRKAQARGEEPGIALPDDQAGVPGLDPNRSIP